MLHAHCQPRSFRADAQPHKEGRHGSLPLLLALLSALSSSHNVITSYIMLHAHCQPRLFRADAQPHKEGRHGSLLLPDTCLAHIMACLARTVERGGLRGPSCVAKELAQASLVSVITILLTAAAAAACSLLCYEAIVPTITHAMAQASLGRLLRL
jgi:hypothetical protein